MTRLIALRKRHKTFGRGTMEFLRPENRRILAYLRRYENDLILVEMLGGTEFPRITGPPYFLSLAPYGFCWFELTRPNAADARSQCS